MITLLLPFLKRFGGYAVLIAALVGLFVFHKVEVAVFHHKIEVAETARLKAENDLKKCQDDLRDEKIASSAYQAESQTRLDRISSLEKLMNDLRTQFQDQDKRSRRALLDCINQRPPVSVGERKALDNEDGNKITAGGNSFPSKR